MTAGITTSAWEAAFLSRHMRLWEVTNRHLLGNFISALWNHRCPENVIVCPYSMYDFVNVGFALPAHKTLVLTHIGGFGCTGVYSSGTIVARQGLNKHDGYGAKGVFITPRMTKLAKEFRGTHVAADECPKGSPLRAYVDALLDPQRNDPVAFEQEFGTSKEIAAKIKRLIGGAQ